MEITVTCRNSGITAQMKSYAQEKVLRITRIFDRLTSAQVVLDVDGSLHKAEVSVHAPRGATVVAHAIAGSMFAALDQLEGRLERQIRKMKTRYVERRHNGGERPLSDSDAA